jgi:hypothetical protein
MGLEILYKEKARMPFKNKVKGTTFERFATDLLNEIIEDSEWKRIPGSGALGTALGEPLLTSDIVGKVKGIPKRFKVEAKVGYGGEKQFMIKKEWLDKVREEADATFATPVLIGKFSGARTGVKVFTVMDVEVFAAMVNHISKLQKQLNNLGMATEQLTSETLKLAQALEEVDEEE